jgi:hypothetical protein
MNGEVQSVDYVALLDGVPRVSRTVDAIVPPSMCLGGSGAAPKSRRSRVNVFDGADPIRAFNLRFSSR